MYRGVEIEVSQALFPTDAEAIADALASTLRRTLDATEP